MMLDGVLRVFVYGFHSQFKRIAQKRQMWRRCTMLGAPPSHAAAGQGAVKNAQQPKPVHRDTVTNCESLPLDRVPSPRVKRGEIRGASGLQHDTADACGVVPRVLFGDVCACRLACLVCVLLVLTAQLPSVFLVQRGIAPLERVLGLVRGRVEGTIKSSIMFSHSLALIFTRVGTRCKCASSHQKPSKCR